MAPETTWRAPVQPRVSQSLGSGVIVGADGLIITNNHVRHLPVVDHGKVVGLISIGDAVKSVMEQQQATIDQLSGYIAGGLNYLFKSLDLTTIKCCMLTTVMLKC